MKEHNKPLLTIGMIFRDDIRTLERCMKSLEPLRRAVPCQLVMADTGSIDGSWAVAKGYADVLFDFPWTDDFSAARNAVMDRACGQWYLTVDSDEWLDGDITELVDFLKTGKVDLAMVVQRNYFTSELDERRSDSWAGRLVRMSAGLRYQGRIHEHFPATGERFVLLSKTVLHHDGYVGMNEGTGQAKRTRNVSLLRACLAEEPENLRYLMQLIESGREEPDWLETVRRAAGLVEEKKPGWRDYGPALFRHAVFAARRLGLPELDAWVQRAEEWFPDSWYTRIDVEHTAFVVSWEREDYGDCVRRGERFLAAKEDYRAGGDRDPELLSSTLITASPSWERNLRILLASSYMEVNRAERAKELLESLDGTQLDAVQTKNLVLALMELRSGCELETGLLMLRLYDELCRPEPSPEQGRERRETFWEVAVSSFTPAYHRQEQGRRRYHRPGYTLFRPLAGRHEAGTAAAILECTDRDEIASLLGTVERWEALPASALEHALQLGVPFPLADRPLKLEEADYLASSMMQKEGLPVRLLLRSAEGDLEDWQALNWARALVLAAVQSCQWEEDAGLELSRAFAKVEAAFLPRYYSPELLNEENLCLLPPLHRFGWYCVRAFGALDGGDAVEYVRLLRAGLSVCGEMKPMAEFLTKNTPQLRAPAPSAELLALAEQVRTVLAAYAPDDPAVEALKSSPAYQKVAHLIEGLDGGGLPS